MDSIDLFPTSKMTFTHKIIVTVRLVIILSLVLFMITGNSKYLWMGAFTAGSIAGVYYYREYIDKDNSSELEPFTNVNDKAQFNKIIASKYERGSPANPLSNVLLTDYTDNPQRNPAPPTFTDAGIDTVNSTVMKTVGELNPTIEDTSKQLFGGLYDSFQLNNSNRAFFSTPNTKIPNDQGAFSQYLYGNMKSCKEDGIQCIVDNERYNLY
jgi:hypothetical protein